MYITSGLELKYSMPVDACLPSISYTLFEFVGDECKSNDLKRNNQTSAQNDVSDRQTRGNI